MYYSRHLSVYILHIRNICVCNILHICLIYVIYVYVIYYIYYRRHFYSELRQSHFCSKTCYFSAFCLRAFSKTESSNSRLSTAGKHRISNNIQGSPATSRGWEQMERFSSHCLPWSLFSRLICLEDTGGVTSL